MEETTIPRVNRHPLRLNIIHCGIIAVLIATGAVIGVRRWLFVGINEGPTLIEAVRTGEVDVSGVSGVEILKFDPGGGWPFSESEYDKKARTSLERNSIEDLLRILKNDTSDGFQDRNHPSTYYYGIFRISMRDGKHYYVFYHLSHYKNQHYAIIRANSSDSTNPNGATEYENISIAEFLKVNDPWYRDEHSARINKRPSFPDTRP